MRAFNSSARPLSLALAAIVLCSAALAEQQALITVNPNNFAPGQNIANATAGAQLLAMTLIPNPDPNSCCSLPQFSPTVFAQPVAANCGFLCSIGGSLTLGYTPTTIPATQPQQMFWGDALQGAECIAEFNLFGVCEGLLGPPVLRVNFAVPTDYATAVAGYFDDDPPGIDAFDSTGHLLAHCFSIPPGGIDPPGCGSIITGDRFSGWTLMTISRPTADISFVLIGGIENIRPIGRVQFHSPVSLQLAGLLTKVNGVGPGHSLADTLMQAQADYAAGDLLTTCTLLTGLVDEVKAQNGKHIASLTASQLLSTATSIEAAIGCN